ncbi:hypothetical protein CMQ_6769 [Grosmannia clavigera kw1407]|uniref:NADAR domain-containing protein n=1 Tax=Grosmannia clavigera (strain kw1407 / UAMH 11150) TaxID=655863 RepID=F0X6N7_GROCL|nr:uncharacterized protein CMQ_6769 [Grosmannia clavigera kw1407]EFX06448.1 hypothetical protein CMQ_6769 [Grosmannia clavigera kw1407]
MCKSKKVKKALSPSRNHESAKTTATSPSLLSDGIDESNPLFFYMPDAAHGEFCQWFSANFQVSREKIAVLIGQKPDDQPAETHDDLITFNCAEQFMMICKAGRFGDRETQRRIMSADSPKEQKRMGKLTEGFTSCHWDPVKSDVVVAGNIAKFGHNPKLKNKLLATGQRLLVEAASRDPVWGIGYTEKHAMQFRKHWGENQLGKALMAARQHLRNENEHQLTWH